MNVTELTFLSNITVNGDLQCATLNIIVENQLEGDDQTFMISFNTSGFIPSGNVIAGSINTTVFTIADLSSDGKEINLFTCNETLCSQTIRTYVHVNCHNIGEAITT